MATLAVLEPDALRRALADSDTKAPASVPGIGKRVAERLVVELRDKVDLPVGAVGQGTDSAGGPLRGQVTEALVGLGFTTAAADKAVQSVLADNPAPTRPPRYAPRSAASARHHDGRREAVMDEHDDAPGQFSEIDASPIPGDKDFDAGLRPRSLADFIGQPKV